MNLKIFFKLSCMGFIGMSLISSPLFSEESDEDTVPQQQHVTVGERALDRLEEVRIREEKIEQIEHAESEETADAEMEESMAPKLVQKGAFASTYYTTHQGVFHRPVSVSMLGNSVELEDGSFWAVSYHDRHKTLDWMTGDTIIITPNHTWFSVYDYRLVNLNTGASVQVNLSVGPIYNGINTHWIIAIDYCHNEICLEDGSVWSISGFDSATMNKWLPNDTLIIGINDGFFSGSNPNILINVNMNNHVIGTCVF